MDNQVFKVTRAWIHGNKTKKGGFTKAQILALGIKYPPESGWINDIDGELISNESARLFEDGKNQFSEIKSMKLKKIISSLNSLSQQDLLMVEQNIKQLLKTN